MAPLEFGLGGFDGWVPGGGAGEFDFADEGGEESHFGSKESPHWKRNQEIESRSLFA